MVIGGVELKPGSRQSVLDAARRIVESERLAHFVTINPEYIVAAAKDDEFRDVLNKASETLIDGIGIIGALKYLDGYQRSDVAALNYVSFAGAVIDAVISAGRVTVNGELYERFSGVDFISEVAKSEWMQGRKIMLLGGAEGVAAKAAARLREKFDQVILVADSGHTSVRDFLRSSGELNSEDHAKLQKENIEIISRIQNERPDVLFVAYGHPWQDLWLARHEADLSCVRLVMGVGGALDYIAEVVPRAPEFVRGLGLEWLYRLIQQPERLQRIVDATWRFSQIVVK